MSILLTWSIFWLFTRSQKVIRSSCVITEVKYKPVCSLNVGKECTLIYMYMQWQICMFLSAAGVC